MISMIVVPIIILVVIGLIVVGVKGGSEKGGENVMRNAYVYLVLFATLMMTIGGSVGVFMAVADIVAPVSYHQSFEDYRRWGGSPEKPNGVGEANLSEQELKARYDAMVAAEKERQIERAKNSLVKSLGWIAIPLPVFVYFQRNLKRKEE